jgi:phenylalanyl-tRNA synthetase beta chain
MMTLLTNVEFKVESNGDELMVTAPFWRTDIEIAEDVVEEIGRLHGYDKLPLDLPKRDLTPPPRNPMLELKKRIRSVLASAGANEVLTYSFVHGNLLERVGQSREHAFQLSNALSPDLQYYRLSLTPSLLELVHPNLKAGHGEFVLFELGKAHAKGVLDEEGLPRELPRLALTLAADEKTAQAHAGAPYYQARTYLEAVLSHFGQIGGLEWQPLAEADFGGHYAIEQMVKPFQPNRSAVLVKDGLVRGVVGEYRRSVQKALKLPAFSAGFELFQSLLAHANKDSVYMPLPRFPKVEQDICLKVAADKTYAEVYEFVAAHLQTNRPDKTHHTLSPVDIYQREDDPDHKQITLRLSIASFERTLTDQEVNTLLDHIATAAKTSLNAERI